MTRPPTTGGDLPPIRTDATGALARALRAIHGNVVPLPNRPTPEEYATIIIRWLDGYEVRPIEQAAEDDESQTAGKDRDPSAAADLDVEGLVHKAVEIGYTYGALGRDFEYAYKNANDLLAAAYAAALRERKGEA